jgi:hypothetical protein
VVSLSLGEEEEHMFCFHDPEKAMFDKTWVLPDIEKIN